MLLPERDQSVRLVERYVARRANELSFELRLRRVLLACQRRANHRERERKHERREHSHESVFLNASSSSSSSVISPTWCATIFPSPSTKNVSGRPVIPHGSHSFAGPSYAIRCVSPCSATNSFASPLKSRTSTPMNT